jgi:hypothetical protein
MSEVYAVFNVDKGIYIGVNDFYRVPYMAKLYHKINHARCKITSLCKWEHMPGKYEIHGFDLVMKEKLPGGKENVKA